MNDPATPETPFEQEADESANESWQLEQGDEIAPGRHALQKLGGGSDYEAYLCWDERMAFLAVAKVLRPHLIDNDSARRGLRREGEMLSRLQHPLLVRGFGGDLDGERPHVLMEHLEGPHLARLIRRYGPLPLEQFVPLATNLASVAHYLSFEEIVHLDIKPRNIVVGVPPKLIDLSVARPLPRARELTGHVGTDLYMAPEQCKPNQDFEIGSPADVWGIGATLYQAITGERAFERAEDFDESDPQQRFPQLTREPPEMNPKIVPDGMAALIKDCLQRDPADRPTAREILERLEPFLAALPRKHRLGRLRPRLR